MATTFFAFIVTLCLSPFIYLAYMAATEDRNRRTTGYSRRKCDYCNCLGGEREAECEFCGAPMPTPMYHVRI